MTPKSLLRLPAATSTVAELLDGSFHPVIDDAAVERSGVNRIVLCSGKVFYDLDEVRKTSKATNIAIIRLEQFYPFSKTRLQELFAAYSNTKEIVWCQEEPQNMGGWTFVAPRLTEIIGDKKLIFAGRAASASPATGSYAIHGLEQEKLIKEALGN